MATNVPDSISDWLRQRQIKTESLKSLSHYPLWMVQGGIVWGWGPDAEARTAASAVIHGHLGSPTLSQDSSRTPGVPVPCHSSRRVNWHIHTLGTVKQGQNLRIGDSKFWKGPGVIKFLRQVLVNSIYPSHFASWREGVQIIKMEI